MLKYITKKIVFFYFMDISNSLICIEFVFQDGIGWTQERAVKTGKCVWLKVKPFELESKAIDTKYYKHLTISSCPGAMVNAHQFTRPNNHFYTDRHSSVQRKLLNNPHFLVRVVVFWSQTSTFCNLVPQLYVGHGLDTCFQYTPVCKFEPGQPFLFEIVIYYGYEIFKSNTTVLWEFGHPIGYLRSVSSHF